MVSHDAMVTGSKYLDDLNRTPAMLIRGEESRNRTPELH